MAQTKPSQERARNMKKILIVDDHPLVRRGLAVVVNDEEDLHVCGEAADAPEGPFEPLPGELELGEGWQSFRIAAPFRNAYRLEQLDPGQ